MLQEVETTLQPEPKLIELSRKKNKFSIGILKENLLDEKRVALTPVGVSTLTKAGTQVLVEKGSGIGANYEDSDYREVGAEITERETVLKNADILVKVGPMSIEQLQNLPPNKILFSAVHPNTITRKHIEILLDKNITAVGYEYYYDEKNMNPFVHLMNEIIGSSSVLIAAELLSNASGGKGIMLGGLTGISPTEIVIFGTDTAAEYAIRMALGLGALVKVFDDDLDGLVRMERLFGQHLYTSTFNKKILNKAVETADVIINSKQKTFTQNTFILTTDHIRRMKKGAVIIDLKIDSGTIIETSKPTTLENPTYKVFDVIHYCVPNIPSRVARTASIAISNVLSPILYEICKTGNFFENLKISKGLRSATYTFSGKLTNEELARKFNMEFKDLNLLATIF